MNFVLGLVLLFAFSGCAPKTLNFISAGRAGIVGGEVVNLATDEVAHSVVGLIARDSEKNIVDLCSAVLIAPRVALTAAHCIEFPFSQGEIVFDDNIYGRENRSITHTVVHPAFNRRDDVDHADLALVVFSGAAPSGYVPAEFLKDFKKVVGRATVTQYGFGVSKPLAKDHESGTLRRTEVQIVDMFWSKTEILTDETHGRGICVGDSGGPSFLRENGKLRLWGISSRVLGTFEFGKPTPGYVPPCEQNAVITSVEPFLPWIVKQLRTLER